MFIKTHKKLHDMQHNIIGAQCRKSLELLTLSKMLTVAAVSELVKNLIVVVPKSGVTKFQMVNQIA